MGCVYEITFPDGSRYVGVTKHKKLSWRIGKHRYDAKNINRFIVHKAINKFGLNLEWAKPIFESEDREILDFLEYELIARYRLNGVNLLNECDGGRGSNGYRATDHQRQRNSQQMLGRFPGSKNAQAKLAESDVVLILEALASGIDGQTIATRFGVSRTKISQIKLNKAWKHVDRSPFAF